MSSPNVELVSLGADVPCHLCGAAGLMEFGDFRRFRRIASDCRPWPAGGRLSPARLRQRAEAHRRGLEPGSRNTVRRLCHLRPGRRGRASRLRSIVRCGVIALAAIAGRTSHRDRSRRPRPHARYRLRQWSDAPRRFPNGAGLVVGRRVRRQIPRDRRADSGVESLYTCPPSDLPGQFDLVSMIHVLEHIPQPAAFLERLLPKLVPGGLLVVELPHHVTNPFELLIADHCTHFSAATAAALLQRWGWRSCRLPTTGCRRS